MGWWSETIMGGDSPLDIKSFIEEACGGLSKSKLEGNLDTAVKLIGEDCYGFGKHLWYQVLGVLIMEAGAAMSEELRKTIMEHCYDPELKDWGNPELRKQYIDNYKDQIAAYDGTPQEVSSEGLFEKLFKEKTE